MNKDFKGTCEVLPDFSFLPSTIWLSSPCNDSCTPDSVPCKIVSRRNIRFALLFAQEKNNQFHFLLQNPVQQLRNNLCRVHNIWKNFNFQYEELSTVQNAPPGPNVLMVGFCNIVLRCWMMMRLYHHEQTDNVPLDRETTKYAQFYASQYIRAHMRKLGYYPPPTLRPPCGAGGPVVINKCLTIQNLGGGFLFIGRST